MVAPPFARMDSRVPFPRTSGVCFTPGGKLVTFGLHRPLMATLQSPGSAGGDFRRTPRSLDDYRRLTEGREHLLQQGGENAPAEATGAEVEHLRVRSRSAEAIVTPERNPPPTPDTNATTNHSSGSLKTFDSSNAPSVGVSFQKVEVEEELLPARRITFAVGSSHIVTASQQRVSRMAAKAVASTADNNSAQIGNPVAIPLPEPPAPIPSLPTSSVETAKLPLDRHLSVGMFRTEVVVADA